MISQKDIDYIIEHYDNTRRGSIKEIAEHLHWTWAKVNYHLRQQGLFKRYVAGYNLKHYTEQDKMAKKVYVSIYSQAKYLIRNGVEVPDEPRILAHNAMQDFIAGRIVYNLDGTVYDVNSTRDTRKNSLEHLVEEQGGCKPEKHKRNVTVRQTCKQPTDTTTKTPKASLFRDRPKTHEKSRPGILVGYVPGVKPLTAYQRMMAECIV